MTTKYKYWVAGVKTHAYAGVMNISPDHFNLEIEVDFEVKTSDDVMKLTQRIKEEYLSDEWTTTLSSWPHLLQITRKGFTTNYVNMVQRA